MWAPQGASASTSAAVGEHDMMGRVKAVIYEEYGALPALADLPEPECP
jgi:hypothetical protein